MKTSLIAASCAILCAPGLASTASAKPLRTAPITAPAPSESVDPKTDGRRVCIVDDTTGTRLTKKVCRTRAEWVKEGVDPLAAR